MDKPWGLDTIADENGADKETVEMSGNSSVKEGSLEDLSEECTDDDDGDSEAEDEAEGGDREWHLCAVPEIDRVPSLRSNQHLDDTDSLCARLDEMAQDFEAFMVLDSAAELLADDCVACEIASQPGLLAAAKELDATEERLRKIVDVFEDHKTSEKLGQLNEDFKRGPVFVVSEDYGAEDNAYNLTQDYLVHGFRRGDLRSAPAVSGGTLKDQLSKLKKRAKQSPHALSKNGEDMLQPDKQKPKDVDSEEPRF